MRLWRFSSTIQRTRASSFFSCRWTGSQPSEVSVLDLIKDDLIDENIEPVEEEIQDVGFYNDYIKALFASRHWDPAISLWLECFAEKGMEPDKTSVMIGFQIARGLFRLENMFSVAEG